MYLQTLYFEINMSSLQKGYPMEMLEKKILSYVSEYVSDFLNKMRDIKNEADMVKATSHEELPLLVSSLKYPGSKKILTERLSHET